MIFLRHPTPDIAAGICYGRTDMGIAENGHEQIQNALDVTPKFNHIFASPAKRCRKLAHQLALREGLDVTFDERLWEMHMGDWEGIAWKDIDRNLSELWLKDPVNNKTPNGECFADLQLRVESFRTDILNQIDSEKIAVVCHAGPIRATQMAMDNLSFNQAFAQAPPYAEPVLINVPRSKYQRY